MTIRNRLTKRTDLWLWSYHRAKTLSQSTLTYRILQAYLAHALLDCQGNTPSHHFPLNITCCKSPNPLPSSPLYHIPYLPAKDQNSLLPAN